MNRFIILMVGCLAAILSSCEAVFQTDLSTESQADTRLNIRLTDDPIDLEAVNIDLQLVRVKGENGFEEIDLETNAGIYNLLDFQNGLDTLIASADLSIGQIREVRLILGENNSVVAAGETHELKIPSGSQSGLKIKTCLDLAQMSAFDLLLDFDAAASIHCTGNGKFIMHPVIRVMSAEAQCGEEEEEEESPLDGLPQAIIDSLSNSYEGYDFEVTTGLLCDSTGGYEITATLDDTIEFLFFELEGELVQIARSIADEEIPEAIVTALPIDFPEFTPRTNTAREIERGSGMIWYSLELTSDTDSLLVIYDPEGTFICGADVEEEEEEEMEEEEEEEEENEGENIDIPETVTEFLEQMYPGYEFESQAQLSCDGSLFYLLTGKKGPTKVILYFDLDWILIQTGIQIDEDQIPNAVQESIETDYGNFRIMNNKSWELETTDGSLYYRVYLKQDNSSLKIYVIYAADGTFICQEE